MSSSQQKPDSIKYQKLISDIEEGIIKVPKFQRDFVWSIEKTAQLLDSILKGYPIGTFILWETDERINNIKNIGDIDLPETPDGHKIQYVLDGQQRLTSLFAAYRGAEIQKIGEKKITDYKNIYIDLEKDIDSDDQVVISEKPTGEHISLNEILNFSNSNMLINIKNKYSDQLFEKIHSYSQSFATYDFSIILLRKKDVNSAIEVFTRINTGGQTLTLFEIMSAKTYDESKNFDMQKNWEVFLEEAKKANYETISSSVILQLLSVILSSTKECKRKTILQLNKQKIIDSWDDAISGLKEAIDYFHKTYKITVSQILPYDTLLVAFAYFFHTKGDDPSEIQRKILEEFFWIMSLSHRYSSSTESKLAQDIHRIDSILEGERPSYTDIRVDLDSHKTLMDTGFSAGSSYCKAVLCLLASQVPKDFKTNADVILDNSWLKQANSKNFHHFFPKSYLKGKSDNANSLINITLVSDNLNKRKIGTKSPSVYIKDFSQDNTEIETALNSHFIELNGFGIENDDYDLFLQKRAEKIYEELKKRIEPALS